MRAVLACLVAALALAAPAGAFELGVASGDVRPTSAVLWTRADRPGTVTLFVFRADGARDADLRRIPLRADPGRDLTVSARVTGLTPGTEYRFSFLQGGRTSRLGSFRTAPRPGASETVRFAWSGDSDGSIDPDTGRPAFGPFAVLRRVAAARPAFFVHLGDTIYSDGPFVEPARTVADYRARYRQNRRIAALREVQLATPFVSIWDDHEVRNDWEPATVPRDQLAAATRAFREYQPLDLAPGQPLYRSFRWGRHLEVFVLDTRSYRSPAARAACTPEGGAPDPVPFLPQPARNAAAGLFPQVAAPPPEGCLDALAAPDRTYLGAAQLAWLERGLARSSATWKVVLTAEPIQELPLPPYDRWEGYPAAREALLRFVAERRIANVVWLAADAHATLVKDVVLDGRRTGMVEVVTGPIGTRTMGESVERAGGPAAATLLTTLLRTFGARCAITDRFSYGLVEAGPRTLVVTPRDASGARLCSRPVRLTAR